MNGIVSHYRRIAESVRRSMDAWVRALLVRYSGGRYADMTDGQMVTQAKLDGFMIELDGDTYTLSQNGKVLGVFTVKRTFEGSGDHVKGVIRISEGEGENH